MLAFISRQWRTTIAAAVVALLLGYFSLSLLIGWQVAVAVVSARQAEGDDAITSLIAVATSQDGSMEERNRAIWALGQLGAREALPTLESLVVAEGCDHDSHVCQHEVRKAIVACSGGFNAGAIVWRHGDLALN